MKLGKLIRKNRLERGIPQGEIATRLGFTSPQYVSNVERGISGLCPKHFKVVARMLKVKVELLYGAAERDYAARIRQL